MSKFKDDRLMMNDDSIQLINSKNPLKLLHSLNHDGCVYGMSVSQCGTMLVTSSSIGSIKIWDLLNNQLITELRDRSV
jgi:WD40 repeat protein